MGRIALASAVLVIALACASTTPEAIPAPTGTVVSAHSPTAPSPTDAPALTPTHPPQVETPQMGQTCPPIDPSVDFSQMASDASIYSVPDVALAYLNQGGDPAQLEDRLVSEVEPAAGVFHHQLTQADLTGDNIPELVLALTFSYGPADPNRGDSTLVTYRCDGNQYQMDTLFVRAGAGDRGEGLFAGGGVRVLDVRDMTGSGLPDLVFASFWDVNGDQFAEYSIARWQGDSFTSLIQYTDILGLERTSIDAGWDYEIRDVDQDGTQELVFSTYRDPRSGELISPAIFAWDGTTYTLRSP